MTENASRIRAASNFGNTRYRLSVMDAEHRQAFEQLFTDSFGHQPKAGWWDWKYGKGGLNGRALGLWDERGNLIAHYGGFPRLLGHQGRAIRAIQIGDVMVARAQRGLLTRQGPFFVVCSAFFERWVGPGQAFEFAFGFPHLRHTRLGALRGLYHDLGVLQQLAWRAQKGWDWQWSLRPVEPAAKDLGQTIKRLHHDMSAQLAQTVTGNRDFEYLQSRFFSRPDARYALYGLYKRFNRWPKALLIFRLDDERAQWLDYVGPPQLIAEACQAATREIARIGRIEFSGWLSTAMRSYCANSNAEDQGIAAYFAVSQRSTINQNQLQSMRWWWMGGDNDFL